MFLGETHGETVFRFVAGQQRKRILFIVAGFAVFSSACARWTPMTPPAPADSPIKIGNVRITKTNYDRMVVRGAVITRDSVTGSSESKPPEHIAIAVQQIRAIEREPSTGYKALYIYELALTVGLLIAILTYHPHPIVL